MDISRILIDGFRAATSVEAAVYALAAIGLNIHFGYTGLLNFGQVGFMLVGAYGLAISVSTFGLSMWIGLLVGIALAVVLALLLGIPTLRLRADYLAITTIAAAEILRFVFRASAVRPITGGGFGLLGFANTFYAINPIPARMYRFGPLLMSERRVWLVVVGWSLVVLASVVVWALMRSPWGRIVRAVREDEDAARSLGKNAFGYKLQALILGGVAGAIAGMLLAISQQTTTPDVWVPQVTFFAWAVLILGGTARVLGPAVGAVLFWFLVAASDSFLRQGMGAGLLPPGIFGAETLAAIRFTLVGLSLMLLMIFRPQGLFGNRREMQLDVQ